MTVQRMQPASYIDGSRRCVPGWQRAGLPPGYRLPAADRGPPESFGGLGGASVAMFGILAILVLEFGTFRTTLSWPA